MRGELCSFVVTLILNGGEYWLRLWTVNCLNWFFEPAVTGCVLVCVVNVCVNVVLYGVEKFIFDFVAAIVKWLCLVVWCCSLNVVVLLFLYKGRCLRRSVVICFVSSVGLVAGCGMWSLGDMPGMLVMVK